MAIDLGLDNPAAMEACDRAIGIVDASVDRLHDEIADLPCNEDCEIYRLARALPPGPVSFDRTIGAAVEATRGALDQISYILKNDVPTSTIVLHSLLRAAVVGSGRIVFALLPDEPEIRLENARVLIAQETKGFTQALTAYTGFEQLTALRPETQYLERAKQQNVTVQQGNRPPGDGVVISGAAKLFGIALAAHSEYSDRDKKLVEELFGWLWNTYSGAAHAHAWPRLLPTWSLDRRVPGDYPGDFHMTATFAHVAMRSVISRLQPGSANMLAPVHLGAQAPEAD